MTEGKLLRRDYRWRVRSSARHTRDGGRRV